MASDFREHEVRETGCEDTVEEEVRGDIGIAGDGMGHTSPSDGKDGERSDAGEGISAEVDAGNFRVMRGRDREEPDRARVNSIKRAIRAGREVARVRIYQDRRTGEKFSPNGAHRRKAYDELGRRVPAIIVTVADARERAERESCFANEANGSSRSPADLRFQAEKAYGILEKELNRPPKPKELAGVIHASDKYANSFLRAKFATAAGDNGGEDDEQESKILASLRVILERLRKIEPPAGWEPGHISAPMKEIYSKN
jgi:hypothetical protein